MNLFCPSCQHRWWETVKPMNLRAAASRFKGMSVCVKCGREGVVVDVETLPKEKRPDHA